MIVESNYPVTIATLSDWLKNLAPIFQPMESKTKSKGTLYVRFTRDFSRALRKLQVNSSLGIPIGSLRRLLQLLGNWLVEW